METALVRVHIDILSAIDKNQIVLLIMLDLSSAFDTVDHSLLIRRLRKLFGICGKALNWFDHSLTTK